MRIVTITLNAAIDTTYVVDRFEMGGAMRPLRQYDMPGGKGNNVARILASLGHDVIATGFAGGASGEIIVAGLRESGVQPAFAILDGRSSRTCIAILDQASSVVTEVLEAGPTVETSDYDRLIARLEEILPGAGAIVISGSAPAGSSHEDLVRVAKLIRAQTPHMIVDSSGDTLDALLEARPDVVKPNEHEIDTLIGGEATFDERVRFAQEHLITKRMGAGGMALLTLGADGGVLVREDEVLLARIPPAPHVNTVGCGDASVAGFADALVSGATPEATFHRAMAFGAAAARQPVAGVVDGADVEAISQLIEISRYANELPPLQRTSP